MYFLKLAVHTYRRTPSKDYAKRRCKVPKKCQTYSLAHCAAAFDLEEEESSQQLQFELQFEPQLSDVTTGIGWSKSGMGGKM